VVSPAAACFERTAGNWKIFRRWYGIHWPDLDEDLSTEGLLRGAPAPRRRRSVGSRASLTHTSTTHSNHGPVIEFLPRMRIFVLGPERPFLLAQLLERKDIRLVRRPRPGARAALPGKKSTIAITEVNARNLRGVVKAAKGCQLIDQWPPCFYESCCGRRCVSGALLP